MRTHAATRIFFGLALCVAVATAGMPADAQKSQAAAPAQFLTLDQDRLFQESLYGQRVAAELEQMSTELAARNREISAELTAEEQALTEKRKTLTPEEFRPLADAFDARVTQLREEQDQRIRALQRRRELERRAFLQRILPVLSDLVREVGAVAILDERAVILSADRIDITDGAIARVNALLGDGGNLEPVPDDATGAPADAVTEPGADIGTDPQADPGIDPGTDLGTTPGADPAAGPDP